MASALIQERGTSSGNQMRMSRQNELALQTFLQGTPLMIDAATGAVKAWDGVTIGFGIAGISKEFGANLAATGVAQDINFGSVPNEPLAVNKTRPYFNDGKTGFIVANDDTQFYAQVGPAQTALASDIGKQYGLTKDVDGHWFIDKTKVGAAAVLIVVGQDFWDTQRGLIFVFLQSACALTA